MSGPISRQVGDGFFEVELPRGLRGRGVTGFAGYTEASGTDDGGNQIVDYAIHNELGTKLADGTQRSPARPFVQGAFERNRAKYDQILDSGARDVLSGAQTARGAVMRAAREARNDIIREFVLGTFEPNAESTLERKAPKTRPLIDTGAMRQRVQFGVEGG